MMKGKIIGCLTAVTSIVICMFLVNQLMGTLFNLGRAAVQLGLQVV